MSNVQNFRLNLEATGQQAAAQVEAVLNQQAQAMQNVVVKSIQFNSAGQATAATIEQLDAAGRKVTSTIELQSGKMQALTSRVNENTKALQANREAAVAARVQDVTRGLGLGQLPNTISTAAQQRLVAAQASLSRALAAPGIDEATTQRVLNDLAQGIIKVEQGPARDLQRAFLSVRAAVESINKELDRTASTTAATQRQQLFSRIGTTARQLFPVPDNASVQSLLAYSQAIQRVQQVTGQTGATLQQVDQLMRQAAASPRDFAANITKLPPELQKVAVEIARLAAQFDRAGASGQAAGRSMLISFTAAARAIELQLLRRGVTAITNSLIAGTREALTYQVQLQQVANISSQTGAATTQLAADIRRISEELAVPLTQVAGPAQQAFASQLGDSARGLQVLNAAAQLSIATGIDLNQSQQLVTTTLQSYALSSDQAAQAANTLFLAAQRTNIPLNELTTTIGRAGITARALGLNFEQVTGIFLTLAQQGRRPAEAFSLIEQIFNRLLNPTTQLQNVLNAMGTPTAQLAIQVHGLSGVLNELNRVAEENPERLGEIAGSLRSLKSILGITGDEVFNIEQNIDALTGNVDALSAAVNNVQATPAQQLRQEFQRISNVFSEDIGTRVLSTIVTFSNAVGGAENVASILFNTVKIGAGAFLAYSLAVGISSTTTVTFGRNLLLLGGFVSGTTAQFNAARASASAFLTTVASVSGLVLFTAAVTGLIAYLSYLDEAQKRTERFYQRLAELDREHVQATIERNNQNTQQINQAFNENVANLFQHSQQLAAENLQLAQNQRDLAIEAHDTALDAFRNQTQSFLDSIRSGISELRSAIQQAESDIRTSQRRIESFQQQSNQRIFDLTFQFAETPGQQLQLINNRRQQLEQEVRRLFAAGDRASIESARERLQELSRLIGQAQNSRVAQQRAQFEQLVRTGQVTPTVNTTTGQLEYRFQVNMNQAIAETNSLMALETELEQNLINLREEEAAAAREQLAAEQERLRNIESSFRNLTQFRIFGPSGQLLPQFREIELRPASQGGGRAAALEAARAAFEAQAEAAISAVGPRSVAEQLQLLQIIQTFRTNFEEQIRRQTEVNNAQLHQQQLTQLQEYYQQEHTLRQNAVNAATNALQTQTTHLSTNLNNILSRATTNLFGPFQGARGPEGQRLLAELQSRAQTVRQAIEDVRATPTQVNQEALQAAVAAFREQLNLLRQWGQAFDIPFDIFQRTVSTPSGTISIGQLASQLENQASAIGTHVDRVADANNSLQNLNNSMNDAVTALGGVSNTNAALNTVNAGLQSQGLNIYTVNNRLVDLIGNLNTLNSTLRGINQGAAAPPTVVQPKLNRATGGYIGYGPSGTDQIIGRLTKGEFVVNPQSTARFFTQLVDINAGRVPKFQSGGLVSNNQFGNIVVNLPTGTSDIQVRDFANKLRREIKRGTIPGFDK